MTFEEQLLMDLKAEISARAQRARRTTRRLLAGAAVAGVAAVGAIALPLVTGAQPPAYAVSKNPDGTVRVEVNEFRDADKLERDLARAGVTADVTYLRPGTRCRGDRGRIVGGEEPTTPEDWRTSVSYRAARPAGAGVDLSPAYVKPGQTLVMEFTENADQTSGPAKPRVLWQFKALVVEGPVQPCVLEADPGWNDLGGPAGRPPAGS
ncbi:hypothetical protein MF672_047160 [Actinomadura sp. ATCC 31491]|uniref:Uncharacterized protein n=1 Tax=Actinomadura luzonensis TaxID=2805427 RepID=A0ABT0G9Q0_9ACTN|nr:hypothetical protein [Actinomadura luzonensis]MCK2221336.1 hypothetical protein [Actinomadura luzonensis]